VLIILCVHPIAHSEYSKVDAFVCSELWHIVGVEYPFLIDWHFFDVSLQKEILKMKIAPLRCSSIHILTNA